MTPRVFVSATSEDLKADCRPTIIQAIQLCEAVAVTMELWDTDFVNAVILCQQKLLDTGIHYIGLLAYRHGLTPPELGKSITEAEFDWAYAQSVPMAVFMPHPQSLFALELKARAANQADAEARAQAEFCQRVRGIAAVQDFQSVPELAIRVTRCVMRWSQGGLLGIAARAQAALAPGRQSRVPRDDEIVQLGRVWQMTQTLFALDRLRATGQANVACFVVHGPPARGQRELLSRLRSLVKAPDGPQARACSVSIGVLWREASLAGLLKALGAELGLDQVPTTATELGEGLKTALEASDVTIEIRDLQRYGGALPAFVEQFWRPVVETIGYATRHRLRVFLALDEPVRAEWEPLLSMPLANPATEVSAVKPICVAELADFTEQEIADWLRGRLPAADAEVVAEVLFAETQGHPQLLYTRLRDEATWA